MSKCKDKEITKYKNFKGSKCNHCPIKKYNTCSIPKYRNSTYPNSKSTNIMSFSDINTKSTEFESTNITNSKDFYITVSDQKTITPQIPITQISTNSSFTLKEDYVTSNVTEFYEIYLYITIVISFKNSQNLVAYEQLIFGLTAFINIYKKTTTTEIGTTISSIIFDETSLATTGSAKVIVRIPSTYVEISDQLRLFLTLDLSKVKIYNTDSESTNNPYKNIEIKLLCTSTEAEQYSQENNILLNIKPITYIHEISCYNYWVIESKSQHTTTPVTIRPETQLSNSSYYSISAGDIIIKKPCVLKMSFNPFINYSISGLPIETRVFYKSITTSGTECKQIPNDEKYHIYNSGSSTEDSLKNIIYIDFELSCVANEKISFYFESSKFCPENDKVCPDSLIGKTLLLTLQKPSYLFITI
jgi:hypothetical protein